MGVSKGTTGLMTRRSFELLKGTGRYQILLSGVEANDGRGDGDYILHV